MFNVAIMIVGWAIAVVVGAYLSNKDNESSENNQIYKYLFRAWILLVIVAFLAFGFSDGGGGGGGYDNYRRR